MHPIRPFAALIVPALVGLLATLPALAQTLKDPALEALHVAERHDELRQQAQQRLATQPDDEQAVLALALSALARDDAAARQAALARAAACAGRLPASAACQYSHGVLLGLQSMSDGMMAAARNMGTVRSALQAAHAADPAWYPARSALSELYLMAPAMMGGSRSKAGELANSAPRPEQAAALRARGLMADDKPEATLAALMALPAPLEPALAGDVRGWGTQAGLALVNRGQPAAAAAWFERLSRERPGHAAGPYGLARVKGAQGDWAEALRLLEMARGLKGADAWPMAWRIGIAQQELGRPDAARASLRSFVEAGKGQKAALEDARKRLAQLGG